MRTLIELYDERPLENVLSTETFRPERTVFLAPPDVTLDKLRRESMEQYFRHRGLDTRVTFLTASLLDTESVARELRKVLDHYPDCAVDISGGTDAALFAAGMVASERDVPVFTYSSRRNRYFNIRNAPFADNVPCRVRLRVEDCFRMAGGVLRQGRVDNTILDRYLDLYEPFFRLFMEYRRPWPRIVGYIQKISQSPKGETPSLTVSGDYVLKAERGRVTAVPGALRRMEEIGLIEKLRIEEGKSVSFRFKDQQIRTWLRDVGSVLELYVYRDCLMTRRFDDLISSAVVDWQAGQGHDAVTNELDVMATRGVTPIFVSCKTCDVKTEALNELAVLRDRFGGGRARAAIVTAENGGAAMRHRAAELGIDVIDLGDLKNGRCRERLYALSK